MTILPGCLFYGASRCLALEPNRDDLLIVSRSLDDGDAGRFDQIGEARKAVVARVEVRRLFRQMRANAAKIGAAVFVGGGHHGLREHIEGRRSRATFADAGLAAAAFGAAVSFWSPTPLSTSK